MVTRRKVTAESVQRDLNRIHGRGSLTLIGKFKNVDTKVCLLCKCGHKWLVVPNSVRGFNRKASSITGCPKCAWAKTAKNMTKSHAEFVAKVFSKHGSALEVVSKYKHSSLDVKLRCACGATFKRRADMVIHTSPNCPKCSIKRTSESNTKRTEDRLTLDSDYNDFRSEVSRLTRLVYNQYQHLINPYMGKRGNSGSVYNLDHCFSVAAAYRNIKGLKHPPSVQELSHPANLSLLSRRDNIAKGMGCSLTARKLRQHIALWEATFGPVYDLEGKVIRYY